MKYSVITQLLLKDIQNTRFANFNLLPISKNENKKTITNKNRNIIKVEKRIAKVNCLFNGNWKASQEKDYLDLYNLASQEDFKLLEIIITNINNNCKQQDIIMQKENKELWDLIKAGRNINKPTTKLNKICITKSNETTIAMSFHLSFNFTGFTHLYSDQKKQMCNELILTYISQCINEFYSIFIMSNYLMVNNSAKKYISFAEQTRLLNIIKRDRNLEYEKKQLQNNLLAQQIILNNFTEKEQEEKTNYINTIINGEIIQNTPNYNIIQRNQFLPVETI